MATIHIGGKPHELTELTVRQIRRMRPLIEDVSRSERPDFEGDPQDAKIVAMLKVVALWTWPADQSAPTPEMITQRADEIEGVMTGSELVQREAQIAQAIRESGLGPGENKGGGNVEPAPLSTSTSNLTESSRNSSRRASKAAAGTR